MRTAGVREVKSKLSAFLRMVRQGETVLVTDHGEVVAQLAPPPAFLGERHESERDALARLATTGVLRPAKGPITSATAETLPAPSGIDVQRILDDVRGD